MARRPRNLFWKDRARRRGGRPGARPKAARPSRGMPICQPPSGRPGNSKKCGRRRRNRHPNALFPSSRLQHGNRLRNNRRLTLRSQLRPRVRPSRRRHSRPNPPGSPAATRLRRSARSGPRSWPTRACPHRPRPTRCGKWPGQGRGRGTLRRLRTARRCRGVHGAWRSRGRADHSEHVRTRPPSRRIGGRRTVGPKS